MSRLRGLSPSRRPSRRRALRQPLPRPHPQQWSFLKTILADAFGRQQLLSI